MSDASLFPLQVAVIMGSRSDLPVMQAACELLDELIIPYEKRIVSAHRTPDLMFRFAEQAAERGISVIIAGAGGAAHLPGMVAAKCHLPVIGVPINNSALHGWDALLSIAQMPAGVPVATMAVGMAGARNAALLAAQILALQDRDLLLRLQQRRVDVAAAVTAASELNDDE